MRRWLLISISFLFLALMFTVGVFWYAQTLPTAEL